MKPKVLVISRDSWNTTNSTGNTLSNMFQNWESDRIANLYCRDEIPNNNICVNYFKISESDLINKLRGKKNFSGEIIYKNIESDSSSDNIVDLKKENRERKLYDFFRNNRWHVFLWAREFLWKLVGWKSDELQQFLKDFNPDIIYSQSYDSFYMHDILQFVKKNTSAKTVFFHCDDLVTYRQYSLSPFYWINRFILRKKMDKNIKSSDKNYCIVDEQARVYKGIYKMEFDLLYKTGRFDKLPKKVINTPLKLVYTGNIICGRIKSIIKIAHALKKINSNGVKAKLYLYTANKITDKIKSELQNTNSVELMGKVPYNTIPAVLASSDVLIHVESFEKQHMLSTSLSFSTKLVDYFEAAKPIFAMGWEKAASIKYLKDNEIGIVVDNDGELYNALEKLINNYNLSVSIGENAWEFGQKHHNKNEFLLNFENELNKIKGAIVN